MRESGDQRTGSSTNSFSNIIAIFKMKANLIYLSFVLFLANQSILTSAETASDSKESANEVTTYNGKAKRFKNDLIN